MLPSVRFPSEVEKLRGEAEEFQKLSPTDRLRAITALSEFANQTACRSPNWQAIKEYEDSQELRYPENSGG